VEGEASTVVAVDEDEHEGGRRNAKCEVKAAAAYVQTY
jgi:hypothetical protein